MCSCHVHFFIRIRKIGKNIEYAKNIVCDGQNLAICVGKLTIV